VRSEAEELFLFGEIPAADGLWQIYYTTQDMVVIIQKNKRVVYTTKCVNEFLQYLKLREYLDWIQTYPDTITALELKELSS
jgi:hypothetical protein